MSFRKNQNQFSVTEIKEEIIHWLETNSQWIWDSTGSFKCLVPNEGTVGIDHTVGHDRFSFKGKKVIASRFVLLYHSGREQAPTGTECSHLCGNAHCINRDHLIFESRQENMSRIGCRGFVRTEDMKYICLCDHTPKCLKCVQRSYTPEIDFLVLNDV